MNSSIKTRTQRIGKFYFFVYLLISIASTAIAQQDRDNIKEFFSYANNTQQTTDSNLNASATAMFANAAILQESAKYLGSCFQLMEVSKQTIYTFRKQLNDISASNTNTTLDSMDTISARITLAALQGKLSLHGIIEQPSEGIIDIATHATDDLIAGAELLDKVRNDRQSWFSGVDSLRNNVVGLALVRKHYLDAYGFLESATGLASSQISEDARDSQTIIDSLKQIQADLEGKSSPDAENLKHWASNEIPKLQLIAEANGKVSLSLKQAISLLDQNKKSLDASTAWLDNLSIEISHFQQQ